MDDRALLAAYSSGDKKAGAALFDRYYDQIARFFQNKVDEAAALDLVQSTFVACVESKERFRGDASVRTFLFGIAHNLLKKHYRSKARRPTVPLSESEEDGDADLQDLCSADVAPSVTSVLRAREEQRLLLEALRRIPIECQEVLELHYWEGMDTAEMAEIIRIPVGTVKSRLQRGRALLEQKLEKLARSPEVLESTRTNLDGWAEGLRKQLLQT